MTSQDEGKSRARPDKAVLVIAVVLVGIAALVAWDAAHLSARVSTYSRVGAAAFPYTVAGALAILSLVTAIAAFRGTFPERAPLEIGPLGWVAGGLFLQIAILPFVGFSIATGLMFALVARGFGGKPLWASIPAGIVLSFVLYVLFSKGLQLSLPQGPLERLI